MIIKLSKSKAKNKKWSVKVNNKTINFGDSRYEDYTQHNDDKRKERYIERHYKRENWDDINTAGFWSRWLLWEKKDLLKAIKYIERKEGVKLEYNQKKD